MRDLKYIIIGIAGFESRAIVFNGVFNHSDIWLGARRSINGCTCESAGFCSIKSSLDISTIVNCWGESESLSTILKRKVVSRSKYDAEIIDKTLNRRHYL